MQFKFTLKIFYLLSIVFVGLIFFLPPIDTDLGWHLRYGNHFLQTRTFIHENMLTYFLSDYAWIDPYTLYQPLTAIIFNWKGLLGLSLTFSLLMALCFVFFSQSYSNLACVNFIVFLAVMCLSWGVFNLGWRGQIFTILGVIITFFILNKAIEQPRLLFIFPLVFLIWANLHAGFVLGLAILVLALIQEIFNKNQRYAINLILALVASLVAALANPYGIGLYKEALHHARYPLQNLIAEWVSPNKIIQLLILFVAFIALLLLFTLKNKRRVFWSLNILMFLALALDARRHLPLFAVSASLAFLDIFYQKLKKFEENREFRLLISVLLILNGLGLILFYLPRTIEIDSNWHLYCKKANVSYPCGAISYIRDNPIKGENVFTAFEWGGFLEWQLPQYKYFVDGRMPAWITPEGKSPYSIYLEIIQAQSDYQKRLDKYGTDWLVIQAGTFLDLELSGGKNSVWQERYRDSIAVIYTRTN